MNTPAKAFSNDTPHGELRSVEMERMLCELVAEELHLDTDTIDPQRKLMEYGLESIDALTIAGDLEDRLGLELESTLLWDYPTIREIAAHLIEMLDGGETPFAIE